MDYAEACNKLMIVGERGGVKDDWTPGEIAYFEYHCNRQHGSADAELWYRDQQQVLVLGDDDYDKVPELDTMEKRGEAGMPRVYRIRFSDGHEGSAVEDELLIGAEFFDPALGPPSTAEIEVARKTRNEE